MTLNTSSNSAAPETKKPKPILREIAAAPRSPLEAALARRGSLSSGLNGAEAERTRRGYGITAADPRLAPILHNESKRSYAYGGLTALGDGIWRIFQEMEDKDGHLYAVLQTRKLAVLSRPQQLLPPEGTEPETPETRTAMALAERALSRLGEWRQALMGLLDALAKGIALVEVIWEEAPGGTILPAALLSRPQARFGFPPNSLGPAGRPHLADPHNPLAPGEPLPERKFLVACFQPTGSGHPAALGLLARAYWYSWFKRNNLKSWALYNDKFGSPTVLARFPHGADEAERGHLYDVVEAFQKDAGILLPEGMDVELLEARRSGDADTYRKLAEWCNDEISKIVLGQTLTTGEGRRSGSLALGRVHENIRLEYLRSDAAMLEGAVQQLIDWVIDFNLGPQDSKNPAPRPRWSIDTRPAGEATAELEVDKELIGLGLPLSQRYFYERYGRPLPAEGEAAINYDDRNIFQYHLRFGVLTVNEVRARMGLPAVEWGDQPVNSPGDPVGSPASISEGANSPPPGEANPERGFGAEEIRDEDPAEGEDSSERRTAES